jgi:threonylcarbamoyladenosine tRNA methylthiotransferase MtaB
MARTFSLKTLGCKLNQFDSARLAESFACKGWAARPFGETVDAVVVNTCTVTDRADKKSRNLIRQGSRHARIGKAVVTGCLADRDRLGMEAMPEVLAVFGNREKALIAHKLDQLAGGGPGPAAPDIALPLPAFARTDGYLKIQDGCDGACAYCVVPEVRGAPRSETAGIVLERAQRSIDRGCPELILTGITIGRYRDSGLDLAGLAESILRLPGKFRLRLTSVEPTHVTERLIDLFQHQKLCSHLHLPLQTGSDRILSLMRRPYRLAQYRNLVDRIRSRSPDVAIGTDLMVGFPGETGDDFSLTLDAVQKIGFAYLHQFTYSPRPGTAAVDEPAPTVSRRDTARRVEALRELARQKSAEYAGRFAGRMLTCVIERDRKSNSYTAVSDNYLKINLLPSPLNETMEGSLARVELQDARSHRATGRLIASV